VRDLFWGFHRFDELQRRLGIARNTLTDRLSLLVDHGVAERVRYQDNPERFEYHLTDKGRALSPVIWSLMEWGDAWSGIEQPPVHLVDGETGRTITPLLVDAETRTPLRDLPVRAIHVDDTSVESDRPPR
jgi:DNA-binding HxlR family transcriptional regulator